jgi:hypothetical protein
MFSCFSNSGGKSLAFSVAAIGNLLSLIELSKWLLGRRIRTDAKQVSAIFVL